MAKLFAWGANSHGQLGLGFKSELVSKPAEVSDLPDSLRNSLENPDLQITGGGGHTIILNEKGELFGAGLNTSGQLRNVEPDSVTLLQIQTNNCEKYKNVSCGWDFSVAVKENGNLYGWGSNSFGQLSSNAEDCINDSVRCCSAGLRFTAHVKNDNVHIKGRSRFSKNVFELRNVKKLSCGQNFCLALDSSGKVFAWGDNKQGQCSLSPKVAASVGEPHIVNINEKISDIAAGWTHGIALSGRGNVYTWGRNSYGQLGRHVENHQFEPVIVETVCEVVKIAAGSEHCMALDSSGRLFTWGWNEHGSCGNDSETDVIEPVLINEYIPGKIINIGCGAGQSFAVAV